MMILGFLFLLLAVWYWIRNRDRKGGMISAGKESEQSNGERLYAQRL